MKTITVNGEKYVKVEDVDDFFVRYIKSQQQIKDQSIDDKDWNRVVHFDVTKETGVDLAYFFQHEIHDTEKRNTEVKHKNELDGKEQVKDVHTEHCCIIHGCKYGEDDMCSVVNGTKKQSYPCEMCSEVEEDN